MAHVNFKSVSLNIWTSQRILFLKIHEKSTLTCVSPGKPNRESKVCSNRRLSWDKVVSGLKTINGPDGLLFVKSTPDFAYIYPQESHFVGSCSRPSVWPAVTTWFFSALNPSSDSWIDRKNAMQRTLRKKRACLPVWRFCLGSVNIWTGQAIWKHPKAHELSQTFTLSLKYIAPAARFNKAPSWVWWHVMAASALWTTLRRVPNLLCCTWEVCSCCAKLGAARFSVDSRVWTGSEDVNTKENNVTLRLHSGR